MSITSAVVIGLAHAGLWVAVLVWMQADGVSKAVLIAVAALALESWSAGVERRARAAARRDALVADRL